MIIKSLVKLGTKSTLSKASFRKQDQFISISYFHNFIREINTIIPLDLNCEDAAEVANMEVPTMKFYKDGFKLHRRGLLMCHHPLTVFHVQQMLPWPL